MPSAQSSSPSLSSWRVEVSTKWNVLGPFPIHAREQHLISPAYPLDLAQPIDYEQTWPSSYADGGKVKWSQLISGSDGEIDVSFPEIRWKDLRESEGWPALQHHAILHTTLTVYSPSSSTKSNNVPHLLVDLVQGSYFTLKPKGQDIDFIPQWFAGNIYDLSNSLPHAFPLPTPPAMEGQSTEYDLFISGDYEMRLFGDPHHSDSEIPVQKLGLRIDIQEPSSIVHQSSQDVVCDFVNGYAFGDVLGIGLQSLKGWWTIENIELKTAVNDATIEPAVHQMVIAPLQMRVVPLVLRQGSPFSGDSLEVCISLKSGSLSETIVAPLSITQRTISSLGNSTSIKGTYIFAGSSPTAFLAIPPVADCTSPKAPIVALHGAGVDIMVTDFWQTSLPQVKNSWTIIPTGRTSWGLDWHGPSTQDVWSSLERLSTIVSDRIPGAPKSWLLPRNTKIVLIGHSNGGQGVWHIAERYPDRVLAVVPAAGYIKSQAYIPLTLSKGGHFIDPALRSTLESSLTPDDNDLHVTNLVNTPIFAIHGGADENVPVWHTRELFATLKAWNPEANIKFLEDQGGKHWYPSILKRPEVEDFIENILTRSETAEFTSEFTLTVSNPRESGSMNGWRVHSLSIPGRLGRLHVRRDHRFKTTVDAINIQYFSIPSQSDPQELYIDDQILAVRQFQGEVHISRGPSGTWKLEAGVDVASLSAQPPGRVQSVLSTSGPLCLIISDATNAPHELSAAQRIAHVLHLYHKIDSEIIAEEELRVQMAAGGRAWPSGNAIFIGQPSSHFAKSILAKNKTPVRIIDGEVRVGQRKFTRKDQALIFSHPHPTDATSKSWILFMLYNDLSGLERVLRLFPFRTGVPIPDWAAVSGKMDKFGAGGVDGAGVWGADWKLSEAMSWY